MDEAYKQDQLIEYVLRQLKLPRDAINLALSSSGVIASASTSLFDPSGAINGKHTLNGWGKGNGWQANSGWTHPNWWGDWLKLTFPEPRLMDTLIVYSFPEHVKDQNRLGLKEYKLQVLSDNEWETLEEIRDNTQGIIVHRFDKRAVKELRLWFTQTDARVIEVEAFHLGACDLWQEEKRQVRIAKGKGSSIAILRDEFPSVANNSPSSPESLAELMRSEGYTVTLLDGRDITTKEVLNKQNFELFVHPYGAVFPLGSVLYEYLSDGGHLLALGGHCFTEALQWEDGRWVETGWDPGLTVTVIEKADWFIQQRDQLALFGAPGHSLNDVAYVAGSPNQNLIRQTIKRDGEITGPSAVGVVGDIPPLNESDQAVRDERAEGYVQKLRVGVSRGRPLRTPGWFTQNYHPLLAQPCSRWLPLVSAYDKFGRIRGTVGAALLHYDGIYRGSRWAYFGADNVDLFAPGEVLRDSFRDVVQFLLTGLTLHSVLSDLDCYRVGESTKLSTIVDNVGQIVQSVECILSVFPANSGDCIHEYRETFTLMPGDWRKVESVWKIDTNESDLYRFQATLWINDKLYDSEEFGFVVWNNEMVASGPQLNYQDNYFSINGEKRFLIGVRDDGFHLHGQAKENSLWWDRQFAMMRDFGQDVFSPVYVSIFVEGLGWGEADDEWIPEKLLRIMDAQVQLTQKHGIVLGITVFFIGEDESLYKPELSRKLCAILGNRYKVAPGIMFYIYDDGFRENPDLFNNWARECRAGFNESGRNYLVTAEWSAPLSASDTHRDGNKELDFVSISCYHGIAENPAQARLLEMRSIGKNFTNAEFGRQAPTGSLTDKHAYLVQPHHQFGMGHAMTINWKWKDNDHAIFPWGIVFPGDWVPKDELYLYRNSALLFRQFHPESSLPPVVVLLPRVHWAQNYKTIHSYLLELLGLLIDLGVDYTVIDEIDIDRLPDTTKVIIYPSPYRAPDNIYPLIQQFVSRGGMLWLAGGDETLAEDTDSGNVLRSLIGAKFDGWLGTNNKHVKGSVSLRTIRSTGLFSGLKTYKGKPDAKMIPLAAQVVAVNESSDAVILLNKQGGGATLYSTDDSIQGARATLPIFLSFASVSWHEPNPQGVRIFKLPTQEAAVYTLTTHRWDESSRTVVVPSGKQTVSVTLGSLGVGMVALTKLDEVCAFEGTKLIHSGEVLINSSGHVIITAIGLKDIRQATGLLLMPSEPGSVSFQTEKQLRAFVGDIQNGQWNTHQAIETAQKNGWVTITIDRSSSRSLILLSSVDRVDENMDWIVKLCKK